jgi:hypothetical protein
MKKSETKNITPKVTRRPADRECFVPFTAKDKRREELLTTIFESGKKVDILESAIKKLKDSAKGPSDEYESALNELKKGKPEKVPCWEVFNWEDRKIIVRRQDNDEIVSENEITEEAVPLTMGDEVVTE